MPTESSSRPSSPWFVPALVLSIAGILIAIIIGVSIQNVERGADDATPGETPAVVENPDAPDLTSAEKRDEGDVLAVGPVDAPVVMVLFSDYQCPFCARWNHQTLPTMMKHVEVGDLRIEWREVNVFGAESERAARAAYAAGLQGRFPEYNAALFEGGKHRPKDQLTDDALIALAEGIGLDAKQFAADFTSDETAAQVAAHERQGLELGVNATPAFIIGGQPVMGAQPTSVFEDLFQTALSAAK